MERYHDIFGPGSNAQSRICSDFEVLRAKSEALKALGLKIVLTSGSFDLFHVGHSRYLEQAKQLGDILIVGVDSDEKIRRRKGDTRPVVPENERMEVVCHTRHVDLVFLKGVGQEHGKLVRTVCPHVLVTSKTSRNAEDNKEFEEFCGTIVHLEPQATASTTARIRHLLIGGVTQFLQQLTKEK